MNYLVGDALIRIKNAVLASKKDTELPKSNMVEGVVKVLKKDGKIYDYEVKDDCIEVKLLIDEKGRSEIEDVIIMSKPGQRKYVGYNNLWPVNSGRGTGVISTSKGFMTTAEAKKLKIGGEYICKIL